MAVTWPTTKTCATSCGRASGSRTTPAPSGPPPQCRAPCCRAPSGSTAPRSLPAASKSTADTTMSAPPPSPSAAGPKSQPTPMKSHFAAADCGSSTTAPRSMDAKETAARCRRGSSGTAWRMIRPSVGSKMSMKCRPLFAYSSSLRRAHERSPVRFIISSTPALETLPAGSAAGNCATSPPWTSSTTRTTPLPASARQPPQEAAATKSTKDTCSGSCRSATQAAASLTASSSPPPCRTAARMAQALPPCTASTILPRSLTRRAWSSRPGTAPAAGQEATTLYLPSASGTGALGTRHQALRARWRPRASVEPGARCPGRAPSEASAALVSALGQETPCCILRLVGVGRADLACRSCSSWRCAHLFSRTASRSSRCSCSRRCCAELWSKSSGSASMRSLSTSMVRRCTGSAQCCVAFS
mmetsp:Transcript_48981/g.151236  ORF Transcript_48981/g.151236 Transcript_48981/m.151236 type:complete len:416 (-) Transcript_48981:418-1665(-)